MIGRKVVGGCLVGCAREGGDSSTMKLGPTCSQSVLEWRWPFNMIVAALDDLNFGSL